MERLDQQLRNQPIRLLKLMEGNAFVSTGVRSEWRTSMSFLDQALFIQSKWDVQDTQGAVSEAQDAQAAMSETTDRNHTMDELVGSKEL